MRVMQLQLGMYLIAALHWALIGFSSIRDVRIEHAIQMINFVLNNPRVKPLSRSLQPLALKSLGKIVNAHGAGNPTAMSRNAEATFPVLDGTF